MVAGEPFQGIHDFTRHYPGRILAIIFSSVDRIGNHRIHGACILSYSGVVETINMKESFSSQDKNSYQHYMELGGIINEKDYQSALDRSKQTITLDKTSEVQVSEVSGIARFSRIALHNSKDSLDPRVALYIILRSDFKSKEEVEYHHSDMIDQRIFAQVLRMLGDADSLKKLIEAYPNISFT